MTNLERGDVVLVLFPNSDLRTFKKRPAPDDLATVLEKAVPCKIGALPHLDDVDAALRPSPGL